MDVIRCSVHYLTLRQIGYEESNPAVTFYHDRTHFDDKQRNLYAEFAEEFHLQQGRHFVLHNRLATMPNKISKLKDQVKEFDSLLQTNEIKKLIWLSHNRLLILLDNFIIIWLIIDTLSGDLVKILIDSSIVQNLSQKLSGKILSDCVLIKQEKNKKSPILIFTYSDKSKIDLITFNKFTQFNDYLTKPKDLLLEKLANFEPALTSTYGFACPESYEIEKRISINENEIENFTNTFTLWWPNDGFQSVQNCTSLLERDDLRNNVLVLSTDLTDSNLLEYLFKSDGLLLSISYLTKNNLIAIEQTETSTNKYLISIYKYNIPNEELDETVAAATKPKSPKIKLVTFNLNSKIADLEQIKIGSNYILMISADQTLVLYDIDRNIIRKFNLSTQIKYSQIEWLINDLIFCVYNSNGQFKLFDVGFNHLEMSYMCRSMIGFKSLTEYLNENLFNDKNRLKNFKSCKNIYTDSLWSCFHLTHGPFGLFRLDLTNNFNHISLLNHYIKNSKILMEKNELSKENKETIDDDKNKNNACDYPFVSKYLKYAVNLIECLNWNKEPHLCLACFYKILSHFLSNRVVFNLELEELIDKVFKCFYKPKRELCDKIIHEFKHQVSRLARRYFYMLVKNLKFEKAFRLAIDIGSKDLFNDLYYCCLDWKLKPLAEVCRMKYKQILKQEKSERLKLELNRSVNTNDDENILDNIYDFDNLSLSSNEIESETDDDSDYEYENLNDDLSLNKENFEKLVKEDKVKKSLPKFYTDDELENFAKTIFEENKFIYELFN